MGDGIERAPVLRRAKDAPAELGPVDAVRVGQEDRPAEVGDNSLVRPLTTARVSRPASEVSSPGHKLGSRALWTRA
jgi:hypothetical protein